MPSIFDSTIFDSPLDRALKASSMGLPSSLSAPAAPETWRDMDEELSEEDRLSIAAQLGLAGLSGASRVGEKLDQITLSRALRGLLGGEPRELLSAFPWSDELGLTERADIVTGKDLAGYLGLRDDPNSWSDDIAGFGIEVALDPTLPLTFGSSAALSGAGKLAKSAGVLSDATQAAAAVARQAGRSAPGTITSRTTTTLRELMEAGPEAQRVADAVRATAQRQGIELTDDLLNQHLSGLVGYGTPFRDPVGVLGSGESGRRVAETLDWLGASAYNAPYSPLPVMRGLFDPDVMGTIKPAEQAVAADATRTMDRGRFDARDRIAQLQQQLDRTGFLNTGNRDVDLMNRSRLYRYAEGLDDGSDLPAYLRRQLDTLDAENPAYQYFAEPGRTALPGDVRATLDELRGLGPEMLGSLQRAGLGVSGLDDEYVDWAARSKRGFPEDPIASPRGRRLLDTLVASQDSREPFLKNLAGGTAAIDEMAMDPNLSGLLKPGSFFWRNEKLPDDEFKAAREYLVRTYGPQLDEAGQAIEGTDRLGSILSDERADDLRALTRWVTSLPKRHSENRIPFYADPTESYLRAMESANRGAGMGRLATDLLAGQAYRSDLTQFPEPTQTALKAIQAIPGLDPVRGGRNFLESLRRNLSELPGEEGQQSLQALQDAIDQAEFSALPADSLKAAIEQARTAKTFDPDQAPDVMAQLQGQFPDLFGEAAGDVGAADLWEFDRILGSLPEGVRELYERNLERAKVAPVLERFVVPTRLSETATKLLERQTRPEAVGALEKLFRGASNAFKFGVTSPWPAFQVRNLGSGDFNNVISGAYSNPLEWWRSHREANDLLAGKNPAGIAARYEQQFGPGLTDQETADRLRALSFAGRLASPASSLPFDESIDSLRVAGEQNPITLLGGFRSDPRRTWGQFLNPLLTRGVGSEGDVFGPAVAANAASAWTEGQNRVSPFLGFLRQGLDPQEAARRANAAQVDYSRATDFERDYLKAAFPFYSFTRGMVPWALGELAQRPSGALAQVVRGQGRLQRENSFVPESVSQQTAIPLPLGEDDGNLRYLTGLGLAYEDPLSLFRPGVDAFRTVQNFGQGLAGRLNPLAKVPIELATGTQLFSGRDLEDLDSGVGRIISNLGLAEEPPEIPILLDQTLANSPLARLLSTIRTATDQRKWDAALPLNLATGVRITDVPEEKSANVAQRQAIEALLRGTNGVYATKPRLYASPEDWQGMTEQQQKLYLWYRELEKAARGN